MYPWFRLIKVIVQARLAPRQDPLSEIRTPMRVWPGDVDSFRHLNNGRYLTLCDLGRFDMVMRTGLMSLIREKGWAPVVATAAIRFRRSLDLFHQFELTTRILFWDEKWFFIEHRFEREGDVYARALIKGVFRGREGTVSMGKILSALDETGRPIPEPTPSIDAWREFESTFK